MVLARAINRVNCCSRDCSLIGADGFASVDFWSGKPGTVGFLRLNRYAATSPATVRVAKSVLILRYSLAFFHAVFCSFTGLAVERPNRGTVNVPTMKNINILRALSIMRSLDISYFLIECKCI